MLQETKQKISRAMRGNRNGERTWFKSGKNHWCWKGGICLNKQAGDKNYLNRKRYGGNWFKVLEKDNWQCQMCGIKEERPKDGIQKILVVHHIDGKGRGYKDNDNSMENLMTLCKSCHREIHRSLYFQFVENLV